jgi:hypothetical protein
MVSVDVAAKSKFPEGREYPLESERDSAKAV